MSPSSRATADVVIVGGGVMGASIAYHLARRGCTNVVVLEASEMFGMGSTGLNAGGIRYQFATPVNIELSKHSIAMMERFADEMDQPLGLKRCGYLFLLDNEPDLAQFRRNIALQNAHEVPSRIVTPDEIAEIAPEIALDGVIGGSWCARDGLVDPHGLLQGYVSNARRLGATLRTSAPVTDVEELGGGVHRVIAGDGSAYETPNVVVAAGAWSAAIGAMLGIDLPIQPIRRQIAVTAPIANLRPDFPFVIDFSRALYFHREGAGLLTGMSNRDELPGYDTQVDDVWRLVHLENAMERMPMLADAEISAEWAGLYEVTPDDQPILGALPDVQGTFVCAGFSGHGLMHGPAAGMLMAEEILDGRATTIDIDPLRYTRFAAGATSDANMGEYNVV
ncbi:MAG TPA: FAD-binding oxidoreductase [Gemmatimonadaceae bacterium]|jgi:sarcosine oxidase subunit beta|nr:FAD-binding oxidoreductase [Gemmatimonadaceae bacterium]